MGLWHAVGPRDDAADSPAAALTLGSAAGVCLLALSLLLAAPAELGAMRLAGITGFHVMLVALTGAFGLVLLAAGRRRG